MAHGDFKDLARRTTLDRVLKDKAFNIANIQNMMVAALIMKLNKIINLPKNFRNQLLKHFNKEKYIHHSETLFAGLIQFI